MLLRTDRLTLNTHCRFEQNSDEYQPKGAQWALNKMSSQIRCTMTYECFMHEIVFSAAEVRLLQIAPHVLVDIV